MSLWEDNSGGAVWAILEAFAFALGLGLFYFLATHSRPFSAELVALFTVGFAVAGVGLCLERRWAAILLLALEALGLIALLFFMGWSALWFLGGIPIVIIPGFTALEHLS